MVIMLIAMLGKKFTANLLSIALGYTLVIGSLPMPNPMVFMQAMRMDTALTSQTSVSQNSPTKNAGDIPSMPCCDAISAYSMACGFLVPQYAYMTRSGDSNRVVNSNPIVQPIYIETVSPPPKA